jgi:hypothetical protein
MTRRLIYGVLIFIALTATAHAQAPSPIARKSSKPLKRSLGFGNPAESSHYDPSNVERFDVRLAPDLKLYV